MLQRHHSDSFDAARLRQKKTMSTRVNVTSPLQDLGQGQFFTSQLVLEPTSVDNIGAAVLQNARGHLHVLQYQPTSRPIEDRFSVDISPLSESNGGGTILLGVYDGHRGPWTAEHVAKTLPAELLALGPEFKRRIVTENHEETGNEQSASDKASSAVRAAFQKFDMSMISTFQGTSNPVPVIPHNPKRKSVLRALVPSFRGKGRQEQPPRSDRQSIDPKNTPAALRVLSGCTASMLRIDFPVDSSSAPTATVINLGDSRTVIARPSKSPEILASSTDVCSSSEDERFWILSQHPDDDPADIFVGKRLFGDTLSTRAFGDGMYKLPLRTSDLGSPSFQRLNHDQERLHRHLIAQLSAHEEEARHAAGKSKAVPLIDRYNALFSCYKTPPYVSAEPNVTSMPLDYLPYQEHDRTGSDESNGLIAILASDGLWDLVSSEDAVRLVCQTINANTQGQLQAPATENLAQKLLQKAVEKYGRHPGDDVTILVLVLF